METTMESLDAIMAAYEDRNLSPTETLIMKAIWDAGTDISVPELMTIMKERYDKDYKRSTIGTFLLRLSEKGFVKSYRLGKLSYIRVVKSEAAYREKLAVEQTDFWFEGKASNFLSALCNSKGITKDDAEKIQEILDGLE